VPLTITVTTTTRGNVFPPNMRFDFRRMLWLTLLSILVWSVFAFAAGPRLRFKPGLALLTLLLIVSLGCSGTVRSSGTTGGTSGGGSGAPPSGGTSGGTSGGGSGAPPVMGGGGTPAGTTTMMLSATSGSVNATLPLTLTVN
jgi:hypothetical protein